MTNETIQPGFLSLRGGVVGAQEGDTVVRIAAWPAEPLALRQTGDQTVSFRGEIPVCIRVCEPICARSDYTVGLTLFDRPIASITVSGITRLQNCGPRPGPVE